MIILKNQFGVRTHDLEDNQLAENPGCLTVLGEMF